MSLPIAMIGLGGHARVCAAALRACGREVVAGTDFHPLNCSSLGFEVMTDEQLVQRYNPDQVELVLGVGGVTPCPSSAGKRATVARFSARGYRFVGFQHPTAWVADDAQVAVTAQIHAGAIVQSGAAIADYTIVNTRAAVDHDCHIGRFCHLAPGVVLSGDVTVGDGTHIGTGASVIQAINIGADCLIAAGAVVVQSIHDRQRVRGVPANCF